VEKESVIMKVTNLGEMIHNDRDGIYNYCPSIFEMDGKRYVYYCTNKDYKKIIDHIGYREAVQNEDGRWKFGEESLVLAPTPNSWDSVHTCDPSVIAGQFRYNGEDYNYLMTYLGCKTLNCQENEGGLAVSKNPEGPWIKVDELNPIAKYKRNMDIDQNLFQWGYGQGCLVSVDKKGEVLLFMSYGTGLKSGTYVERWDFSNLNNPVRKFHYDMPCNGLLSLDGKPDYIKNGDFCYDMRRKRLYAVDDCRPHLYNQENVQPTIVSAYCRLSYIQFENDEDWCSDLSKINVEWKTEQVIGREYTGFVRNHNCGLVTDKYGHMLDSHKVELCYTMSLTHPDDILYTLWSYRIHSCIVEID